MLEYSLYLLIYQKQSEYFTSFWFATVLNESAWAGVYAQKNKKHANSSAILNQVAYPLLWAERMRKIDFNPSLNNHSSFIVRMFLGSLRIKLVQMKFESSIYCRRCGRMFTDEDILKQISWRSLLKFFQKTKPTPNA